MMREYKISRIMEDYPYKITIPTENAAKDIMERLSEFSDQPLGRRSMEGWSMMCNDICAIYLVPYEGTMVFFKTEEDAMMMKLRVG